MTSDASELERRSRRFNETTGVFGYATATGVIGGNHHPDRCVCQGNPNPGTGDYSRSALGHGACGPNGDTTPHKHYAEPPHGCARCPCRAYEPALPDHPQTEAPRVGLMRFRLP